MLKVLKHFFLFGLIVIKTGTGFASGSLQDTILPAQTADLSLRFHHIEPHLSIPGLVASWSMDEGSGYEFQDESNNNHKAYITGYYWNTSNSGLTASFRKKGKRGGAVFLDGTQWLQVKDSTDLNSSSITVSLWVNQVQPAARKTVLWFRENDKAGYALYLTEKGSIALQWKDAEGKATSLQATALILPQTWTHLGFTIDGKKKEAALFVNGKIAVKRQGTTFSTAHLIKDVYIGGTSENANACFKGYVDEVCLYNKALDPAWLHDLFINGHPKIYTQYRTTIDSSKAIWTAFSGNHPVPHSKDGDTKLLLRFNGNLTSAEGIKPIHPNGKGAFAPGFFGGAYQSVSGSKALMYPPLLSLPEGSFEAWYISAQSSGKQTLFKIYAKNGATMELVKESNNWIALLKDKDKQTRITVSHKPPDAGTLSHIALTWKENVLALWLNGALKKEIQAAVPVFNGNIELGDTANERFTGSLDDVRISSTAKSWGQVCPAGSWDTESAALDFMDDFDNDKRYAFHWATFTNTRQWQTEEDKWEKGSHRLRQAVSQGFNAITHPFAYGLSSSIEAGVFFDEIKDGNIGLFTNSNRSTALFTGIRFSMNSKKAELVLVVYKSGKVMIQKKVPYPFPVRKDKRYTLTLSVYEDMARGFVDGNNLIALPLTEKAEAGHAGLFTENSSGGFDDFHFSALTPAAADSRMLQARIMTASDEISSFVNHSFNAFRWKKRYGLLPWQRSYKNPEPPGNIFGPNDVARPNKTQSWRSEDAANSDIITIDGTMYYCMRGNPDHNGPHGLAAIGMLLAEQHQFDGVHFTDLNRDSMGKQGIGLLHGHEDKGGVCADAPPRSERFQVNDEGMVFVDGKILIIAREFRNRQQGYPPFRRLVFGLFDVGKHKWISHEPFTVSWSAMNPDSCHATFRGINATPEIISIIDPKSGKPVILLFHSEFRNSMVTGLSFDGKDLHLHPDYPSGKIFSKRDRDAVYGQRVLFDNGIYYMHVNAGSDSTKLRKDWPDRFQLFTALDPYRNTWTESAENSNQVRPYFTRGDEMDPDNAAIWQGTLFKFRNRYYMYYENYHSINNRDNAYDLYDEAHSGSRVGYATAN